MGAIFPMEPETARLSRARRNEKERQRTALMATVSAPPFQFVAAPTVHKIADPQQREAARAAREAAQKSEQERTTAELPIVTAARDFIRDITEVERNFYPPNPRFKFTHDKAPLIRDDGKIWTDTIYVSTEEKRVSHKTECVDRSDYGLQSHHFLWITGETRETFKSAVKRNPEVAARLQCVADARRIFTDAMKRRRIADKLRGEQNG